MNKLFQANGSLSPGIYSMDLLHFQNIFVNAFLKSSKRSPIFMGFISYLDSYRNLGILHSVLVDGSFVSLKLDPNDIDISLIFDAQKAKDLSPSVFEELYNNSHEQQLEKKHRYFTHPYRNIPYFPPDHALHFFSRNLFCDAYSWWGRDREEKMKGIVLIPFTEEAISEIGGLCDDGYFSN